MRDQIDVIDERIKGATYRPRDGVILQVGADIALVQRVGSVRPIPCQYDHGQGVAVGKRCVVDWVPGRRFVITSVYNAPHTIHSSDQRPGVFELFPPASVTATGLPGNVLIAWEVPAQLVVTFEVQRNSTPVEVGATTVATTRGNAYLDPTGTAAYYRVRSITSEWRYSGWSAWVEGIPGALDAADIAAFTESVQDIIGAAISAGANINVTYDDGTGLTTISVVGLDSSDISYIPAAPLTALTVQAALDEAAVLLTGIAVGLHYRQFVYDVIGGALTFVTDDDGFPIFELQELE